MASNPQGGSYWGIHLKNYQTGLLLFSGTILTIHVNCILNSSKVSILLKYQKKNHDFLLFHDTVGEQILSNTFGIPYEKAANNYQFFSNIQFFFWYFSRVYIIVQENQWYKCLFLFSSENKLSACNNEWLVSHFTLPINKKIWKVFVRPEGRNFFRGIKGTPKEDTYQIWSKSKQNYLSIYLFSLIEGWSGTLP